MTVGSRCFTARELEALRAAAALDRSVADRLLDHLGRLCSRCWRAQRSFPKLTTTTPLATSIDPVVLALRTLDGLPPSGWLRPAHQLALEEARLPLGFWFLVLEEARNLALAMDDPAAWIDPWTDRVIERDSAAFPYRAAELEALALAYLADAYRVAGCPDQARRTLELAGRIGGHDRPASLLATLAEIAARIDEAHSVDLATAQLELAIRYLVETRHTPRRAEIHLDLAELQLRHDKLDLARLSLWRAKKTLGLIHQPFLNRRSKAVRQAIDRHQRHEAAEETVDQEKAVVS